MTIHDNYNILDYNVDVRSARTGTPYSWYSCKCVNVVVDSERNELPLDRFTFSHSIVISVLGRFCLFICLYIK